MRRRRTNGLERMEDAFWRGWRMCPAPPSGPHAREEEPSSTGRMWDDRTDELTGWAPPPRREQEEEHRGADPVA